MKKTIMGVATLCAALMLSPALSMRADAMPLAAGMTDSAPTSLIDTVQFNGRRSGGPGINRGGGGFNRGGGVAVGNRGVRGGGFNRGGRGVGVGAAAVGLGILGIAAAAAANNNRPTTVYDDGRYYGGPRCFTRMRAVRDQWGNYMGEQPVRVCR